ncbi:carcinoembryonic antigen-related cell adhesion molecule 21-like isoform X2 [Fukomys damarensis]|uniref:carcinoembryonic antigen-related cell adhesion molecule 21-like isoform X2 n=1 Tax=Fukomys damarensis TaxID=885580 RepID=UPI0008FED006|nr:carcinoembryonic antigen-related cell adhesion molecule 21-like isoform X2 [Fukomys damarensis]
MEQAAETMETCSATSHRGLLPWQGLLLAASLLTFWNPPTTAQMTIDSVPSDAAEGGDVLLLVHNLPANKSAYSWFKGGTLASNNQLVSYSVADGTTSQGPAYSHRETIYPNGSLLFRNVILGDTGVYTLQVTQPNFLTEIASGQFRVHQPVSPPSIQATNTTVAEEDSLVLTCLTGDTGVSIRWVRDDQTLRLTDRMMLSPNSSVLTIDPVSGEDAGEYQCEVFNPGSSRRSSMIRLEVKSKLQPAWELVRAQKLAPLLLCFSHTTQRGARGHHLGTNHGPGDTGPPSPVPGQLFPSMRNY